MTNIYYVVLIELSFFWFNILILTRIYLVFNNTEYTTDYYVFVSLCVIVIIVNTIIYSIINAILYFLTNFYKQNYLWI